ncbi:MAG: hypothetical protein Q8K42_03400 [Methylobacter sp.]|nr:hypothetical protein [Methylobacter sp.]
MPLPNQMITNECFKVEQIVHFCSYAVTNEILSKPELASARFEQDLGCSFN